MSAVRDARADAEAATTNARDAATNAQAATIAAETRADAAERADTVQKPPRLSHFQFLDESFPMSRTFSLIAFDLEEQLLTSKQSQSNSQPSNYRTFVLNWQGPIFLQVGIHQRTERQSSTAPNRGVHCNIVLGVFGKRQKVAVWILEPRNAGSVRHFPNSRLILLKLSVSSNSTPRLAQLSHRRSDVINFPSR